MFDVIWTDPKKELVGERRARKEKKREKKPENERSVSSRFSVSTKSSRSSSDSPFRFLRSRALGKSDKVGSKARTILSSGLLTPSLSSSQSPHSNSSGRGSTGYTQTRVVSSVYSDQVDNTQKVDQPQPETSHMIQTLGPSSYVIKRTEISWKTRSSDDEQDIISKVVISSEPDSYQPLTPPSSPPATENMPLPLFGSDLPVALIPGLQIPSRSKVPMSIPFKPNNPENWRPPEEWSRLEPEAALQNAAQWVREASDNTQIDGNFELLQEKVNQMALVCDQTTLSFLRSLWGHPGGKGPLEVELEKKFATLSALHHLEKDVRHAMIESSEPFSETQRILMLFESQTTTSYIAALYPNVDVYHLSTLPLRSENFPTVHPIFAGSASSSALPLSRRFEAVYSLLMPSLFSSAHIPVVLGNIRKSLKPGGCLYLTLIDPLPCEETLGPVMRAWFDKHMLPNFRGEFSYLKNTGPSKLFPEWMLTANLRGIGSKLSTTVFCALPESVRHDKYSDDPFYDELPGDTEKETRAEIRSYIGRSLWEDVWGSFVMPGKYWWQDEACIKECLERKTCWEYRIIKGVRAD